MTRVITVASGKGGVGKTTITANLGVALSTYGEETTVLDADVAMANLELILGMEGKSVTLHDVLSGEASIEDAIYEGPYGVKVVPAGISLEGLRKIRLDRLEEALSILIENTDILLIDAPAGLEKDALAAIAAAQEMILVTTPEIPSISDALKTKIVANKLGVDIIGVVVNREQHDEIFLSIDEIETVLEVPVIAIIPNDLEVSRAAAFGEPLVVRNPISPASNAIMQLGADLLGEEYRPIESDKYDKYSKINTIENKIKSSDEDNSIIEVFDPIESQADYSMDINKAYLDDSELKKPVSDVETEIKPDSFENEKSKPQNTTESVKDKLKAIAEAKTESSPHEIQEEVKSMNISNEMKIKEIEELKLKLRPEKIEQDENVESEEPDIEFDDVNRIELMKKYGLKDVDEEEVDDILENYQGGSLSEEDAEKIEFTLMNRIKKLILGIPKIKGAEVMVFLNNDIELTGTIHLIAEYRHGGFLSKIMGESRTVRNLERQMINITQIEIRRSFRGYPEIVDYFEINVEVS